MRIDSSGNVGIGESSPSEKLHVKSTNRDMIIVHRDATSGDAGIQFKNNSGNLTNLVSQNAGDFVINTGGSERMRIDGSGNVLVGKTSSGIGASGFEFNAGTNSTYATRDGGTPLQINRLTSDGVIISLKKDGTTVGSIGVTSNRPYFGKADTGIFIDSDASNAVEPYSVDAGSPSNNAIDLGSASTTWRNIYV